MTSVWVAFSHREFFAPRSFGVADDPLNRDFPPPSSPMLQHSSNRIYARVTRRPSSLPTPLSYTFMGSCIETSISRRCLPFTNNSKVPVPSSIDPKPRFFIVLLRPQALPLFPSSFHLYRASERILSSQSRNPQNGKRLPVCICTDADRGTEERGQKRLILTRIAHLRDTLATLPRIAGIAYPVTVRSSQEDTARWINSIGVVVER